MPAPIPSVRSTSLTKACRWVTSEVMTSRNRGSDVPAKLAATISAERFSSKCRVVMG